MKSNHRILAYLLALSAFSLSVSAQSKKKSTASPAPVKEEIKLKTQLDSISYALGVNIGNSMKATKLDSLKLDLFMKAVEAVYTNKPLLISYSEGNVFLGDYFRGKQQSTVNKNKEEGEKFLAENKTKMGVKTLPSGMQYIVLKDGTGPIPNASDKVKTHYHGTLIDGKVFDSSVNRGEPAEFPVNGVIQGWQEALQLMKTGSKWKLFVPYNLAYGERGAGGDIGPYATLVFEVELLEIVK